MSYDMKQLNTQFFMEQSNLDTARNSLLTALIGRIRFQPQLVRTLEDAISQFSWNSWNLKFDEHGNVNGIKLVIEKAGEDNCMFNAIAPYVKAGSYIRMEGEGGALWQWVFDGKCCTIKQPTISW